MSLQATAQQALNGLVALAAWLPGSAPEAAATADELFERANAYEATQPGYAADLRVAAQQARSRHFSGW